jgi:hypothetical protein
MDRSNLPPAAAVAVLQPRVHQMRPTRSPPASSTWAPAGPGTPEETRRLAGECDRIAQRLNNIVVHQLFAAGLDLQAALGLVGDHPAADRISQAIGELDQAITDPRNAAFDHAPATAAAHPDGSHG